MSKLITTYDRVYGYLKEAQKYRDDDKLLVARFWYDEMKAAGIKMDAAVDPVYVIRMYVDGKMTNHDTITRARRKVQEEVPEFRGASYAKRQGKQQAEVKAEVRQLTKDKL